MIGMVEKNRGGFFLLLRGTLDPMFREDTGAFRGKKVSLDTIKSHGVVYR